jgi:hypothetical protein
MTNKTTDALDRLTYAAYGISIRDGDEIDADVATIRAALDNPMTLPDAPEGWRYEEIGYALGSDFIVGIGQQGSGAHHKGSATELKQAALNAIAKIKGE